MSFSLTKDLYEFQKHKLNISSANISGMEMLNPVLALLCWEWFDLMLFSHLSSESTHTNQLCSISQCNSDSLLTEVKH
jgi:hypothetical protein